MFCIISFQKFIKHLTVLLRPWFDCTTFCVPFGNIPLFETCLLLNQSNNVTETLYLTPSILLYVHGVAGSRC